MTVAEMIAEVRRVVDEDDAVIRGWILDRIRRIVSRSRWRKTSRELGPTVAGQADYAVADDIVDVVNLWIGGNRYARVSLDEMVELQQSRSWVRGARGAWSPQYGTDASKGITIWPTPETGGDEIASVVAVLPPDTPDTEEPPFPDDLHHHIWRGAIADGLGVGDEDPQAAKWEAEYREGEVELASRAKARMTPGPGRIRVPTY